MLKHTLPILNFEQTTQHEENSVLPNRIGRPR